MQTAPPRPRTCCDRCGVITIVEHDGVPLCSRCRAASTSAAPLAAPKPRPQGLDVPTVLFHGIGGAIGTFTLVAGVVAGVAPLAFASAAVVVAHALGFAFRWGRHQTLRQLEAPPAPPEPPALPPSEQDATQRVLGQLVETAKEAMALDLTPHQKRHLARAVAEMRHLEKPAPALCARCGEPFASHRTSAYAAPYVCRDGADSGCAFEVGTAPATVRVLPPLPPPPPAPSPGRRILR